MRNLLLIFPFLCCSFLVAQNNIRLYTATGEVFKAYLEGASLNEKPEANISVSNIKKDTVKIKVELNNGSSGESTLYLLEKGKPVSNKEFNYLITKKDNKIVFNFTGTHSVIRLPEPLVPVKPVVDTTYKLRDNVLGHYCELKEGKASYFNNLPKEGDCKTAMPEIYMAYVKQLMLRAQVEDDKYKIAENTCLNNCVSVSQLNRILTYIPYEIEKLKLVKTSYFQIADKNNSSKLDSTLKLESSKKELKEFLKNADEGKIKSVSACTVAANQDELNEMCKSLAIYNNDSERFDVFRKIYDQKCYSANQVKLVLSQFIHDREKLQAAKLMYFRCTEKENFKLIEPVFSYNSSVAEIQDFITKQNR